MRKMINLSNYSSDLDRFHYNYHELEAFLEKHELNGIELIQYDKWDASVIPSRLITGLHLPFWPSWLDFWRMDLPALEKQYGNDEIMKQFYGGNSPEILVEQYRSQMETAVEMGAEYVVFHAGNIRPEHSYNYQFTDSDEEVVEAAIQLINMVCRGLDTDVELLFENLWWPGLTMLDRDIAQKLIEETEYSHKGFMLDIGHLMNTNIDLQDEDQAVEYILGVLEQLGDTASYIKGIHLNSSLSGEYVKSMRSSDLGRKCDRMTDFTQYGELCRHISKIDRHIPFTSPSINRVIQRVNPEYLVYEVLTDSLAMLDQYVQIQNSVLEF